MPTIFIDGQSYEVKQGDNLLEAVQGLGLELPYFCWHPALGSVGACRQCAVVQYLNEEDTRGRIVMGCMTPVTDGARFSMQGEKATEFRENVIESLMLNHPHDCPVCAEGGECHLQDMTVMSGHRDRHYRGQKNTYKNQYLGPLINHEMNRCITCYRCERFYRDYAGGKDLAAQASHDHVYFGRHQDGVLESEFSGNLVEVCPTGVFTDKPLVNDYTRKWDLQSAPSICTACAVGCNTTPGERYGRLKRVHNRYNSDVNGYFLCDRGRFGSAQVNAKDRLDYAGLRNSDGRFDAINTATAMERLQQHCNAENIKANKVLAIGSPRASVETNYLARRLVGATNFCSGFSDVDATISHRINTILQNSLASIPSLKQVEEADAIFILGEDVTNTAPRLALSLRQSVRNKAYELAGQIGLLSWQDAAIRNLAQDQRSPLFIATTAATKLDDVAQARISLAPDQIAALGFSVASKIDSRLAAVKTSDELDQLATTIASALMAAKKPLIISGSSCQSLAMIEASAHIANALEATKQSSARSTMLSLCLPECNSLGLAMLNPDGITLSEVAERAQAGQIDTLIICENDLYRRAQKSDVDRLLSQVKHVVVLDSHENETAGQSHLVIPVASFAETEASLINNEGRAQRSYPVFKPALERQETWRLLLLLGKAVGGQALAELTHFDQITRQCASDHPVLAGLVDLIDTSALKVARQPKRYSGRTAMNAGVSMHEPQQAIDDDTPLSYSMEGFNDDPSSSLQPFVWQPGWNSNQALGLYARKDDSLLANTGVRLITSSPDDKSLSDRVPEPLSEAGFEPLAALNEDQYRLVPIYRLYGSEELSVKAEAIAELVVPAFLALHPDTAKHLSLVDGDGATLLSGNSSSVDQTAYEVIIDASLALGCVGYSAGFADMAYMHSGCVVGLSKTQGWKRRAPVLIASDGGRHHG